MGSLAWIHFHANQHIRNFTSCLLSRWRPRLFNSYTLNRFFCGWHSQRYLSANNNNERQWNSVENIQLVDVRRLHVIRGLKRLESYSFFYWFHNPVNMNHEPASKWINTGNRLCECVLIPHWSGSGRVVSEQTNKSTQKWIYFFVYSRWPKTTGWNIKIVKKKTK